MRSPRTSFLAWCALGVSFAAAPVAAQGGTFGGIFFPGGAESFADAVLRYQPAYGGGCVPTAAAFINPQAALGIPNYVPQTGAVSLGSGGLLEVAFTDNVLTNSANPTPDLHIFEQEVVEDSFVAIRPADAHTTSRITAISPSTAQPYLPDANGDGFYEIGKVAGSTASVDIDAFFSGAGLRPGELRFDAVQIIDDILHQPGCTGTVGADIDAVGAIASSGVSPPTPLFMFNGKSAGDAMRFAAAAGDVNADGYPDIVTGASGADPGGMLAAGEAVVFSGRDGTEIHRWQGATANSAHGRSVAGAGDIDGDGFADVVVGAPGGGGAPDSAFVYSGQTGVAMAQLLPVAPVPSGSGFGISVDGAGDVNADGYPDVIVGAQNPAAAGYAQVFSGLSITQGAPAVIMTLTGQRPSDLFGASVAGAGDVDRDGYADVIVGAYNDDSNGPSAGRADVFSGQTGLTLWSWFGATDDRMGHAVDGLLEDVNGDTHPDLLVASPWEDAGSLANSGCVRVYSGMTGAEISQLCGRSAGDLLGYVASRAGHVNADMAPDIIVGAGPGNFQPPFPPGYALVATALTGQVVHDLRPTSGTGFAFSAVSELGDVDFDGYDDLLIAQSSDFGHGADHGTVWVYASNPTLRTMHSSNTVVSLTSGNTQTLSFSAGAAHAGQVFVVLGSLTGVAPGFALGSVQVPLNLDPYTLALVNAPTALMRPTGVGLLDAAGSASAQFALPPNLPRDLCGTQIHHGFVVLDALLQAVLASNPAVVALTK